MGNIKNFNFNKLDVFLSNTDYWDMSLSTDENPLIPCSGVTSGDSNVVWYDFNNNSIYSTGITSANTITSLVHWNNAINTGYTLNTFGLTGIDNGYIGFNKLSGDTDNQALLSALTTSSLVITSGETNLKLSRVTGTTNSGYTYNIKDSNDISGKYISLCGGFYQGFYKLDGTTYELLPNRVNESWSAEFWVKPENICSGFTGTTLNDLYPDNKGFFFYIGTRAENKFWNIFNGLDSGSTSGCSGTTNLWCTVPKETDIFLSGDSSNILIPLSPPVFEIENINNQFLIYGRGNGSLCGGSNDFGLGSHVVCSYSGGGINIIRKKQKITNTTNPFLVYGRSNGSTCSCDNENKGYGTETVSSFTGFTSDQTEIDYKLDIIDNALGFRIKDDGSIGYRKLTQSGECVNNVTTTGISIEEGYSVSGLVSNNIWSYIVIKFIANILTDCQLKTAKPRNGKLLIYINGVLKHTFYNFIEPINNRLDDSFLKQVGVPFNFSLGGGSQGLLESQTFDGPDYSDRGLPIETYFGGSFIGGISQFKYNITDLTFCDIKYNYKTQASRYGLNISNHGHC